MMGIANKENIALEEPSRFDYMSSQEGPNGLDRRKICLGFSIQGCYVHSFLEQNRFFFEQKLLSMRVRTPPPLFTEKKPLGWGKIDFFLFLPMEVARSVHWAS